VKIFHFISEVQQYVKSLQADGNSVGFVPTMGALHQGHISLVLNSIQNTDKTIVSIFVNPTQFNDPNDLKNYPRNFDNDRDLLEKAGCDAIFYPSVEEMYPQKDTRVFDFNGLDSIMEGEHRPGHFNGVAQVVSKLFKAIPANKAFFGLKDFQQVAIIKRMVKDLNIPIEIVPVEIVRENDGLAMSSRNLLLTPEHRQNAPLIYHTLVKAISRSKTSSIDQIKKFVVDTINKSDSFDVEYFEIVHIDTLKPVSDNSKLGQGVGCIAVWAGKVRLIDNIIFNF